MGVVILPEVAMPCCLANDRPGVVDAGADDSTVIDCTAESFGRPPGIPDGGPPTHEIAFGLSSSRSPDIINIVRIQLRCGINREHQVVVALDDAGHQCSATTVNNLGVGGDKWFCRHFGNQVTYN